MKLICPTDELAKALSIVSRSVGARAGIPALSGVLVELTDTELSLTTTDLELTTRVRLPVSGHAGRLVVPARYFTDIIKNLPSPEAEIVSEDSTVRISGGSARYSLRSLPAEDFPQLQTTGEATSFTVDAKQFSAALNQVTPAASRDETRPVLTGVLFEAEDSKLRLVATDSYRLALCELDLAAPEGLRLLVPARAVSEFARLAANGEVTISVTPAQVSFEAGSTLLSSRLIEGDFPAYRQVIPTELPNVLSIDRAPLLDSLRRVALLAQDTTPVHVELDSGRVGMQCQSQGVGEVSDEIPGDYSGAPLKMAFNPGYLEAGIMGTARERVRLEIVESQDKMVIRGEQDGGFTYLLLPIRMS